jgi:hypothetical protein
MGYSPQSTGASGRGLAKRLSFTGERRKLNSERKKVGNEVGWLSELVSAMEGSSASPNNIGARAAQVALDTG